MVPLLSSWKNDHLKAHVNFCGPVPRLSEIQNGFAGPKTNSAVLAYASNVKFSQNLPDRTKFYRKCPSVLRISESLPVPLTVETFMLRLLIEKATVGEDI